MSEKNIDMNEMLGNMAQTSDEEKKITDVTEIQEENVDIESYINVFPGNGLNLRELVHLSARIPVNMVMVAGPYASGKTTLIVMMYHLFREGLNKKLRFRGSKTMLGYWKRSEKLMQYSANEKPEVDRTPLGFSDNFLHLSLVDSAGNERDVVFIDIPGELFSEEGEIKELEELFPDIANMIVVIDMQEFQNNFARRIVGLNTKAMMSSLIKYHILSNSTSLQIVCTKMDSIKETENMDTCKEYVKKVFDDIEENYRDKIGSLSLQFVSALELDKEEECRHLEDILEKCVLQCSAHVERNTEIDIKSLTREIDKFGLRR